MRLLAVALLLALGGCAPAQGEPCQCNGASSGGCLTCTNERTALFCESGTFELYRCPGVNGCLSNQVRGLCDFRGAEVESGCPKSQATKATCSGTSMLTCTCSSAAGCTWQARNCSKCSETDGQITCTP